MTSNLLIGACNIPLASDTTTFTQTADSSYPITNLFGGNKAQIFKRSAGGTGNEHLSFDVGSPTMASNFLFIAKANLLKSSGVTSITLSGGATNGFGSSSTVYTDASFASASLVGPQSEDYIHTFATSTAYRYWFMNYNSPSLSSKLPHSKLFFGSYFDPGRDPTQRNKSYTVMRTRGSQRRTINKFSLSWEGVSEAKAVEFHNLCSVTRRYNSFVLFTNSYHGILNGWQCFFCRVLSFTAPPVITDVNNIQMEVEELI